MLPEARRDDDSAPFFDSLAAGRLSVLRCQACSTWLSPGSIYPTPLRCPGCGSPDLRWEPTEGTGHIVTWTTDPSFPSVVDGTPGQTAGIVELTEGPWVLGALAIAPHRLAADLPVRFEALVPAHGGEPVPAFRPAGDPEP